MKRLRKRSVSLLLSLSSSPILLSSPLIIIHLFSPLAPCQCALPAHARCPHDHVIFDTQLLLAFLLFRFPTFVVAVPSSRAPSLALSHTCFFSVRLFLSPFILFFLNLFSFIVLISTSLGNGVRSPRMRGTWTLPCYVDSCSNYDNDRHGCSPSDARTYFRVRTQSPNHRCIGIYLNRVGGGRLDLCVCVVSSIYL